jgi:purine-binding chemotaxis protein CheW
MTNPVRAQIVTFRLDDDLFAADINEVERVLRFAEPTPVPNVPEWVQGVIEYRSRVVPVIDLRTRFGLPAKKVDGATRLMVLTVEDDWIAAVVDAVLEVVPILPEQLAPPPPLFHGLSAEFLRGILRRDEHLVIVLDVGRLLSVKERLAYDRTQTVELPERPVAEPMRAADGERPKGLDPEPALPAPDALIITRSGDPLLNDPLEPSALPRAEEPAEAEPPVASGEGDEGEFRRADG